MHSYYQLIKPGIVYGNAMTAVAAFVFASHGHVQMFPFLAMVLGLSLSIAASCVVNNVLDRDIDVHMERTKDRATVTGTISVYRALVFAGVLGGVGMLVLFFFTNTLTLCATLFAVIVYVGLYTPAKRLTSHSTLIGAVAGAMPPVVGYVAVSNLIDATAILLFLILMCWQMTHFFAIAIFRKDEYGRASLPVMPIKMGMLRTKILMTIYAILFAFSIFSLGYVAKLGLIYGVPMGLLAIAWVLLSFAGFRTRNDRRWARSMFFSSLILLVAFSLLLALS